MSKLILAFIVSVSSVTTVAFFTSGSFGGSGHSGPGPHVAAPEIDPASAVTALTLLLGGVTVLRSRGKR